MDLHGEDLRLSGSWADSIIDLNQMPYINFPFQENYGISPILRLDQPASQFIINGDRLGVLGSLSPPAAPVTPGNNWVARDERESAGQCPRGPITICFGSGASEVASTERETAEESAAPAVEFEKTSPPKPKKKKHRPKVVREGKPVRTPKPSTPKPSVNASGKRKYVRKNSAVNPLETPSSGLAEEQGESIERNGDPPVNASGKRKYVRKNSAVNPPETPSSGLAEEQGESRERDGDPPVNASGKRKYVRKNLAVHPPETPLNGIQEERGEFRERNEGPRPVRRRLDFSFEEASQLQPTESKSTTQDPVDSCLTSLDILPAAQIQPSRRELIRWNLKKLARMRNGNLIEWLSHTPPGASLTFETNPGVDFAFPSTSYSVDHSPRDARDVLKKKRTGRARSRISENTEELEKVNPLQKDGPLALSSEREDFLSLESIIQRIKCLEINDQSKSLIETEHESKSLIGAEHQSKSLIETETALVPYTPGGALVPYKSQALKKLRPKVNLDEESIRVWNLLMGKESNNEENKDKEKRWEEERKVFRGRVDSFIAKMHLVQGDRTFSPWKGSVLDSVIGVFLTQNVSDHLSSSAFMAMAAKFPPVAAKVNSEDNSDRCRKPFIVEEVEEIQINEISSSASGLEVNSEEDSSKTDIFSTEAKGPIVDDNLYNLDSNISFMKLLEMASSRSLPELLMLEKENLFNSQRLATPPMEESSKVNGRESKVNSENSVVNGPVSEGSSAQRKKKGPDEGEKIDWDKLRRDACHNGKRRERRRENMDSLNWEAVKNASVNEISTTIKERGMNNMLAARIKDFLARLEREHGSLDLEWLRDVPPDKAKDFLLSIKGLGLKSVECVRLLTLHHLAFPVDTNVGRISVRLGWVPLQPLPESLQLHLLELYPLLETIQKYLWPRLCTLDQRTLYELHYQMITFGKVFCTKSRPNCNACPLRGECRHFASAFASARLALPGPEERSLTTSSSVNPYQLPEIEGNVFNAISSFNSINNGMRVERTSSSVNPYPLPQVEGNVPDAISSFNLINTGTRAESSRRNCEPIIEEPASPEPESPQIQDIEDGFYEDPDEIPLIKLNIEEFSQNLQDYMQENSVDLDSIDFSKAMVMISQETASIPTPKLKNISRLRTEHLVYEIPDSHCLLEGMDRREAEDPSPYLLAIWSPGETTQSVELPESCGGSHNAGQLCDRPTCFSCNSLREAQSQTVRGTILIPCRTAMRGSFPLNGTYFQVNEVFADHDSSLSPINVPRSLIWNLPRRTVYFGTSVPTIFRGLAIQEIQNCFWRGFVCVRGFDRKTRGPRPLIARLHFPASRMNGNKKTAETELE